MRCLLIEDFTLLRESIVERLSEEGYVMDASNSGDEGLWFAENHSYDVIILDLMLPKIDGLTILRKLRHAQDKTPILIISAKDAVDHRVAGLDAGADDYLIKPLELKELSARVRALARRRYDLDSSLVTVGDLTIDCVHKKVTRAGREITLTPREYRLLKYLAHRAEQPVSRKDIWEHVYDDLEGGNSNSVDVYIGHLRKKLNSGNQRDPIRTRRGYGYLLTADVQ